MRIDFSVDSLILELKLFKVNHITREIKMIQSKTVNGTLEIKITDKFTVDSFNDFQKAYSEGSYNAVSIDFSETSHIDSGGLGMLLQLRTFLGDRADIITLKGISDQILKVFEVVNFEKLFKMA